MSSLIDASSAIHAWQHYPIEQFPKLWDWLAKQINQKEIQSIKKIMDEIEHKEELCYKWLKDKNTETIETDDEIAQEALSIMKRLNITDTHNNAPGVNFNDVLLIAAAKKMEKSVISNEAVQNISPTSKGKNYKIPLVCRTQDPKVNCLSFLEFIKEGGAVF